MLSNWANRVTVCRILLIAPYLWLFFRLRDSPGARPRHILAGLFALIALTDMLDGWLARRFNQASSIGRILDPLADKLLITASMIVLWWIGIPSDSAPGTSLRIPAWVALAALGKDVFIALGAAGLRLGRVPVHFSAGWTGKTCTFAQLAMIFLMLLAFDIGALQDRLLMSLWIATSVLAFATVVDYTAIGLRAIGNRTVSATPDRGS